MRRSRAFASTGSASERLAQEVEPVLAPEQLVAHDEGGGTEDAPRDRLSRIGGVPLGNIQLNFGAGGVTQFADANGNVKGNQIQQDGFPAGSLQTVSIGQNGRVVGNYSNGRNIDLLPSYPASLTDPAEMRSVVYSSRCCSKR